MGGEKGGPDEIGKEIDLTKTFVEDQVIAAEGVIPLEQFVDVIAALLKGRVDTNTILRLPGNRSEHIENQSRNIETALRLMLANMPEEMRPVAARMAKSSGIINRIMEELGVEETQADSVIEIGDRFVENVIIEHGGKVSAEQFMTMIEKLLEAKRSTAKIISIIGEHAAGHVADQIIKIGKAFELMLQNVPNDEILQELYELAERDPDLGEMKKSLPPRLVIEM